MSAANPFAPATRQAQKARILITGPQGSGKSFTALAFAAAFGEKVAVIDTEHDRMRLYADRFRFDHLALADHNPRRYVEMIEAAEANGYDVVVIDSLSHAWKATLQAVDAVTNRGGKKDSREGWKIHRPAHEALFAKIVNSPIHIIATARSKVEYDWDSGKKSSQGYAPIQDDEMPYEFDFVLDMTHNHQGVVSKVRGCSAMADRTVDHPDARFIGEFKAWLDSGAPAPERLSDDQRRSLVEFGKQCGLGEAAFWDAVEGFCGERSTKNIPADGFDAARAAIEAHALKLAIPAEMAAAELSTAVVPSVVVEQASTAATGGEEETTPAQGAAAPPPPTIVYEVESTTEAGVTYEVTDTGGVWACTCKGFEFSKADPRGCKHIEVVREGVAKDAA